MRKTLKWIANNYCFDLSIGSQFVCATQKMFYFHEFNFKTKQNYLYFKLVILTFPLLSNKDCCFTNKIIAYNLSPIAGSAFDCIVYLRFVIIIKAISNHFIPLRRKNLAIGNVACYTLLSVFVADDNWDRKARKRPCKYESFVISDFTIPSWVNIAWKITTHHWYGMNLNTGY